MAILYRRSKGKTQRVRWGESLQGARSSPSNPGPSKPSTNWGCGARPKLAHYHVLLLRRRTVVLRHGVTGQGLGPKPEGKPPSAMLEGGVTSHFGGQKQNQDSERQAWPKLLGWRLALLPTAELRGSGSTTPSGSGQKHLIHGPRVLAPQQCSGFVPHHESPASSKEH